MPTTVMGCDNGRGSREDVDQSDLRPSDRSHGPKVISPHVGLWETFLFFLFIY